MRMDALVALSYNVSVRIYQFMVEVLVRKDLGNAQCQSDLSWVVERISAVALKMRDPGLMVESAVERVVVCRLPLQPSPLTFRAGQTLLSSRLVPGVISALNNSRGPGGRT
jgi:hypothetical protein